MCGCNESNLISFHHLHLHPFPQFQPPPDSNPEIKLTKRTIPNQFQNCYYYLIGVTETNVMAGSTMSSRLSSSLDRANLRPSLCSFYGRARLLLARPSDKASRHLSSSRSFDLLTKAPATVQALSHSLSMDVRPLQLDPSQYVVHGRNWPMGTSARFG